MECSSRVSNMGKRSFQYRYNELGRIDAGGLSDEQYDDVSWIHHAMTQWNDKALLRLRHAMNSERGAANQAEAIRRVLKDPALRLRIMAHDGDAGHLAKALNRIFTYHE